MDFTGPIFDLLVTWQNGLIMVACGSAMAAFKRGPLTKKFAEKKWGKIGAYYAPWLWCWMFLFVPWGLAPADASIGAKLLLGVVLGMLTSGVYGMFIKTVKHLMTKSDDVIYLSRGK